MHMMLSHGYDYAHIYVLKWARRVEVEGGIVNVQNDYCHKSIEETHNLVASCQANNESNFGLSQGFISRCVETGVMPHDLSLCPQPIIESGHVFPDIDEFRNALYTMSLVDRFQYKFKKNSPKQIYVCCLVDGCPWRIIAHSVGITKILKANIFNNVHNHYVGVECSSQPSMQAMRSIHVIKQIIRATLQYLPYQICKDFKSRVSELFGVENHAYCYHHVKKNFSSYVRKHSMKGKKGKKDAMLRLDTVAYARLDDDYVVAIEKLKTYKSDLEERHYTIFNLVITHMDKFAHLAFDHMTATENWKALIGLKTEEKLLENIIKSESFHVYPYVGSVLKVFNMKRTTVRISKSNDNPNRFYYRCQYTNTKDSHHFFKWASLEGFGDSNTYQEPQNVVQRRMYVVDEEFKHI
uniref:Transposase MuDR plant domain-containing protein n=1 Tax=Vitis vinifera TaxID=29760 RepID=A5BW87_VITVI|nr:hypothetical protein VITISV_028831 [Vitis vinifera]